MRRGFLFCSCKKGKPFLQEKFSLRSAPWLAVGQPATLRSAQSVFCDVHAAAKNGLDLFRAVRGANSVRL